MSTPLLLSPCSVKPLETHSWGAEKKLTAVVSALCSDFRRGFGSLVGSHGAVTSVRATDQMHPADPRSTVQEA